MPDAAPALLSCRAGHFHPDVAAATTCDLAHPATAGRPTPSTSARPLTLEARIRRALGPGVRA